MTDLNEEMSKRPVPTSEVVDAEITDVELTTRADAMPVDNFEDGTYPYDDWNEGDRVAVIEYAVDYEGEVLEESTIYSAPESYHPVSNIGRFEKQYNKLPEKGMEIQVSYDSDGNSSIVIADRN